ncbi:MAG: mechanosensitive ion channel family protein [Candidatus Bipolaricaulaceae bacterium]
MLHLTREFLARSLGGNPVWAWLLAVGILLAVLGALLLVRALVSKSLDKRFRRRGTVWAGRGAELTRRTTFPFLLVVALLAASLSLKLPEAASRAIRSLAITFFLIQLGVWGNELIKIWLTRVAEKRRSEGDNAAVTTFASLGLLFRIVLWTVVVLLILQNLGVNVTAMLAGVGIIGLAVGFAAQSILADLFAFLAIVVDKPFLIGDFIANPSFSGTVERIGLRTTRIRSLSGEEIVIANSELLRSWIRDYARIKERWVSFTFAVSYETPAEKLAAVPAIVKEVVESVPKARFDRAHFKEYGEFGLIFEAAFFVESPSFREFMDARHAVNLGLRQRLEQEGIQFAFPVRRVLLERRGNDGG